MEIQPYLFFEGRCEEAAAFYAKHLGAQVLMKMHYRDNPQPPEPGVCGGQQPDKVMHMTMKIGDSIVLASDGMCSGKPDFRGVSLSLTTGTPQEAERLFAALADGGQVQMPMAKSFFTTVFGMVADRFGVSWMVYVAPADQPAR